VLFRFIPGAFHFDILPNPVGLFVTFGEPGLSLFLTEEAR